MRISPTDIMSLKNLRDIFQLNRRPRNAIRLRQVENLWQTGKHCLHEFRIDRARLGSEPIAVQNCFNEKLTLNFNFSACHKGSRSCYSPASSHISSKKSVLLSHAIGAPTRRPVALRTFGAFKDCFSSLPGWPTGARPRRKCIRTKRTGSLSLRTVT